MTLPAEAISLTEAIKRYASVLSLEQIIALRQFHREFLYAKVTIESGMMGTETGAKDVDCVTIKIIVP